MTSFTVKYPDISKRLISKVSLIACGDKLNNENLHIALWDTGATGSVITQKIINELNLIPVSCVDVSTTQGTYEANCYFIDIRLTNGIVIPNLYVVHGEPTGCDILIGMDIINRGDFAVSNFNNKTQFTFRMPSVEDIDFIK